MNIYQSPADPWEEGAQKATGEMINVWEACSECSCPGAAGVAVWASAGAWLKA